MNNNAAMTRSELEQLVRRIIREELNNSSNDSYINIAAEDETQANNTPDIEVTVLEWIHDLGIPAHIKGYGYLKEAIMFAIEHKNFSITKELYPLVATKYSTTPSRVERAIRHAIEVGWNRGNPEFLKKTFGCTIVGRPTNSELIVLVADRIRLSLR